MGRSYGARLLPMAWLLPLLLSLLLSLVLPMAPIWAAGPEPLQQDQYLCDGDPLEAAVFAGAVDAPDLPNTAAGTAPGAYVVLQWRGVSLQLPRTNNAGAPSYTDGRWWWQATNPQQPQFRQRRGEVETYNCQWQSGPERD
ncbi:MAG: hypothetical protein VKM98_03275 [Cyanobacteriota bacterium]|nr:hypothetical protein [Cyanobacteriota bacterium]